MYSPYLLNIRTTLNENWQCCQSRLLVEQSGGVASEGDALVCRYAN